MIKRENLKAEKVEGFKDTYEVSLRISSHFTLTPYERDGGINYKGMKEDEAAGIVMRHLYGDILTDLTRILDRAYEDDSLEKGPLKLLYSLYCKIRKGINGG